MQPKLIQKLTHFALILSLTILAATAYVRDFDNVDAADRLSVAPVGRFVRSPTTKAPLTDDNKPTEKPQATTTTSSPSGSNDTTEPEQNSQPPTEYDTRAVVFFLESHYGHPIKDPRVFFTDERTSRSISILINYLPEVRKDLRFAFVLRYFKELGRKIASKLNLYANDVSAILKSITNAKDADTGPLVDAVDNTFESKEDTEKVLDSESRVNDNPITMYTKNDTHKEALFNKSLEDISNRFANIISYSINEINFSTVNVTDENKDRIMSLLGTAINSGAHQFINLTKSNDKFGIANEVVEFMNDILKKTMVLVKKNYKNSQNHISMKRRTDLPNKSSFDDLNQLSDKTSLIGAWNNYLFNDLESAERLVKVFASCLLRVPNAAKDRWINMHRREMENELKNTLPFFVNMQRTVKLNDSATHFIGKESLRLQDDKAEYLANKNRLPSRCYVAGKRWRLILKRSMKGYENLNYVIEFLAESLAEYKKSIALETGKDLFRLCLPKLESGLLGRDVLGELNQDQTISSKLKLTSLFSDYNTLDSPFESGVKLGYTTGFKFGYNDKRGATLESEKGAYNSSQVKQIDTDYLQKASVRLAKEYAAKKTFEVAVHEGFILAMKPSLKAGSKLLVDSASRVVATKCLIYGRQAGKEAGRTVANNYLFGKKFNDANRTLITQIAEDVGMNAGKELGEVIGPFVSQQATKESYIRSIIQAGNVEWSKYLMTEFESGAKLGFKYGYKTGGKVASMPTLDKDAPKEIQLPKASSGATKMAPYVDHWEKELMSPLSPKSMDALHAENKHIRINGILKGTHKMIKAIKQEFESDKVKELNHKLEISVNGYIVDDIAYLTLNGTADDMKGLSGSLITRNIFDE